MDKTEAAAIDGILISVGVLRQSVKAANDRKMVIKDYDTIHKRIGLLCSTIPGTVAKEVGEAVYSYFSKIDKRDDSFFIKSDFKSDLKATESEKKETITKLLGPLKQIWGTLSTTEKNIIWLTLDQIYLSYLPIAQ